MHRETKATGIPIEVKKAVFKRDGEKCVWCGSPRGVPTAHIIRRSQGGRGIKPHEKITIGFGAIRHVTGAEQVCTECAEAINKVDWNGVARKAIKETRK